MHRNLKVFWLDDEHNMDKNSDLIEEAKDNGIDLIGFESLEDGLQEIKENYEDYDAVILDANFKEKNENPVEDKTGKLAIKFSKELKDKIPKKFDPFILTGNNKGEIFKEHFGREFIFRKNDLDPDKLWNSIKRWFDSLPDNIIKGEYVEGFDVCSEKYIGNKSGDLLLKILKNDEDYNLNYVRQILEALFKTYENFELVPKNLDFAQTSRFLSGGVENNFQLKESSRLPTPISETLRCIIRTVNPGSHYTSDEELKKDVDKYLSNKYSKKAVVLLLIDVLIDFKRQVDNNPIKNNWNEIDSLEGEITWLNLNGGNGRLKCDEHSNLFFYLNESENSEVLNVGDRVKFSIGKNDKGPKAEKLVKIDTI